MKEKYFGIGIEVYDIYYICNGVPKVECGDAEGMVREFKFGCLRGGSKRQRYSHERVLPDDLTSMSLRRYCGSEE